MKYSFSFRISLIFIAALLNSGVMMVASSVLQGEPNVPFCFAFGAFLTVALYGVGMLLKRVNKWVRIAIVVAVPFLLWWFGIIDLIGELAVKYSQWFLTYDLASANPPVFAAVTTMILAGIISALYSTPFVAAKPRTFVVLVIFMAIAFAPYPFADLAQLRIATNVIVVALLYLVILSGYTRMAARYNGKLHARPYQVIGLPICAVIVLFSLVLPYNEEGHPELLPESLRNATGEGFFNLFSFGSESMSLNESGTSKLGGGNSLSDVLLFDVRTDELFYYYADTYMDYTGSSWERGEHERSYGEDIGRELGKEYVPISIMYHNLTTSKLLLPRNISEIRVTSSGYSLYTVDDLSFTVVPDAKGEFTYEAWAYKKTVSDAEEFLNSTGGMYHWSSMLSNTETNNYLSLPDTVTERTRELSGEITAGMDSNIEKIKAIQNYLSKTYPYTLDAPALPDGADFVDFFLFEAKTGYCTSYASAMTVMLRTLGIPARYCEGFAPDVNNNEGGVYHVYGKDAHAWVEVYIPSAGWVEFDPTGSSNAAIYRGEQPERNYVPNTEAIPERVSPTPEPTPEPEPVKAERKSSYDEFMDILAVVFRVVLTLLVIVAIPIVWVLAGRLYVKYTERRVMQKSLTKQAYFWYENMLDLLKSDGHVMQKHETMREFIDRAQRDLPSSGIDLFPAIALMEKVIYNNEVIAKGELSEFATAHRQLSTGLHAGWNHRRQWWETNFTFRLLWGREFWFNQDDS